MVSDRHILFLIQSLYEGGAEKVCCILASAMAEKNQVTIAYVKETEKRYPIDSRCEVIRIPWEERTPGRILRRVTGVVRGITFCRRLKRDRKIDIAVSFLTNMNQLNLLSRRGERVITSERANPKIYQPEKFWRTRIVYALSDHVVFQSEKIRSFYGKRTCAHSSIIWNPVQVSCSASEIRTRRVVSVGRLTDQKNYSLLVRGFCEFHKVFPEYTLSIYGEGGKRDSLQELIDCMGMHECVFLEGNHPDVHEKIRDAEMFVLSSNYEGMSNALLECMMMGIACISTRCEGSTDVIRDRENGLLIDIGDEKQLTEAMVCLAKNPEFRKELEVKAVQDSEAFKTEVIVKKWEDVFRCTS